MNLTGRHNGVGAMTDPGVMRRADGPMDGKGRLKAAKLRKAVNDFEALFVNNMLKTMRSTIQKSGLLGEGMREDIYTSLFDWEISKEMASGGGLGLGRMLLRQFSRHEAHTGSKGPGDGPAFRKKA